MSGVTLIEMLVVLAIISLSLLLFAPMIIGAARKNEPRQTAEVMASTIRGARADALAGGRPIDVFFDVTGRSFKVESGPAVHMPPTVAMEFTGARELIGPSGEGVIRLNADGSSSGALIRLKSDREIDEISVDWLTGSVRFTRERLQ